MNFKTLGTTALAVSACGLITALSACKGKGDAGMTQQAPELAVITVNEENASLETGFPTTLEGENDVEIRPQIQGFLTKVCVQEGQSVSKGQTLFIIDQVQLEAQVQAASAAVQVAQANVNTASTNMNNNKMLFEKNIISQSAYQISVDSYNAAKASLNQANAQLTNARRSLAFTVVTAPTSGIVGTIDFREGSLVSPQTLLTVLSNNGDMRAPFSLNEKDILALTRDGKETLSQAITKMPPVTLLLANGQRYPHQGKIVSISGVIDPSTGSASAQAIFPNPNGMLHSGNTGQILIPQLHANSILVPQSATFEVQDMRFVYVVGDSNKVHSRAIQVADENDGQNFIVTGGLQPGESVVVEGVGVSVKDDMVIRPKK